jgi:membrane fusion protein, multidrug efflux system
LKRAGWVFIGLAVLTSCGTEEARRPEPGAGKPVEVQTTAAAVQDWPDVYEASGTVRARTSAVIASKVMGYVTEVHVSTGDRVREGQPLVTLDARDLEAALRRADAGEAEAQSAVPEVQSAIAAAKSNLDLAQTTFNRIQDLAAKKSVSNQEFDEASARLKAAQAAYQMAESRRAQVQSRIEQAGAEQRSANIMRGYADLTAPFAGVVTSRSAEPGALASPGVPLLTVEREGSYRLEASVEESKLGTVHTGQKVSVAVEGCRAPQRVSEIVPAVDAASRSYIVKVELNCPSVRSGMFGRVEFPAGSRKVIGIPAAAVIERGQLRSVFVAENGAAHNRLITVGRRSGDAVEVLSGLSAGEQVIAPIPAGLEDGARVEVRH